MALNDRTPVRDGRFDERVVLVREATTTVSAGFLDDLLAALDAPAKPNAALQRAAKRARDVVERV